jgi:hypothetical protein
MGPLVRQLGLFYSLYLSLQVRSLMGVENLSSADVENLVAPVKSLRLNAHCSGHPHRSVPGKPPLKAARRF